MRLVCQSEEARIGILMRCKLQRRDVNVDALTVEEESSDNRELRRILDRIGRVIPQEDEVLRSRSDQSIGRRLEIVDFRVRAVLADRSYRGDGENQDQSERREDQITPQRLKDEPKAEKETGDERDQIARRETRSPKGEGDDCCRARECGRGRDPGASLACILWADRLRLANDGEKYRDAGKQGDRQSDVKAPRHENERVKHLHRPHPRIPGDVGIRELRDTSAMDEEPSKDGKKNERRRPASQGAAPVEADIGETLKGDQDQRVIMGQNGQRAEKCPD